MGDPNGVVWQSGAIAQGGGLAGSIAALAGIGAANPSQSVPLPEGRLDSEGLTQPWLFRTLARGPW